jgi:hypothetical protein
MTKAELLGLDLAVLERHYLVEIAELNAEIAKLRRNLLGLQRIREEEQR